MSFITDKLHDLAVLNEEQNNEATCNNEVGCTAVAEGKSLVESKSYVSRFKFEVPCVMQHLREHVIGQEAALNQIENMLKVIKAGLCDPNRPLGVALLLGPTGVGKTSTARLLTEALCGNQSGLCKIDMNTLAQEHYSASLTGAPPGYVGSKEGNTLFDANVIAGSYSTPSVVLFDELEKASKEVLISLLDVLDSGEMTLTSGVKKINFRNAIILMTSNLGAKEVFDYQQRTKKAKPKKEQKIIQKILERSFLPEFINRIDALIYYGSISKKHLRDIIDLELSNIVKRSGHEIILSSNARDYLQSLYDLRYGVRNVKRVIATSLLPLVASRVLAHRCVTLVDVAKGELVVSDP